MTPDEFAAAVANTRLGARATPCARYLDLALRLHAAGLTLRLE